MLKTTPVLISPDYSLPFYNHTDAFDFAIGAVLAQEIEKSHHPVVFINRLLTRAERKWMVSEKECLAVIWAVEKLRPYIEGYHFTVITDYSSLMWLKNIKDPTGRLGRWAMKLLAYDMTIVHRPGKDHIVPDALSRAYEDLVDALDEFVTLDLWYINKLEQVRQCPKKFPNWKIIGGNLYYHCSNMWIDRTIPDFNAWKFAVPEELKKRVLQECHDSPQTGHYGREKTCEIISRCYFWPGFRIKAA